MGQLNTQQQQAQATQKAIEEKAKKTTCIIIKNIDGKYLATSRKDNYELFGLPGGQVEKGETPEEGAIRELKEETGLDVVHIELADKRIYRNTITRNPPVNEMVHCYIVVAKGQIFSDKEAKKRGEGIVRWITLKELLDGTFHDYNRAIARDLNLR